MPLFEYTGFDRSGKKVSGVLEGSGRRALLGQLRQKGIHATSLKEEKPETAAKSSWRLMLPSRIPRSDVAIATRQPSTRLWPPSPDNRKTSSLAGSWPESATRWSRGTPCTSP